MPFLPRIRPRARALLAAGTAIVALAAAGPASADSISYVKNGDIWLTTPDGTRQYQVTHSGIYSGASQADDGTFIALSGERLQRISRTGTVLADFATPVSDGPPHSDGSDYFNGPYDPQISPDGTRVAYTYYWQHYSWDPTCNWPQGCFRTRLESGLALTYSDRLTSWDEFGGPLTGWKWANWVDDDTILRSDAGVILNEDVVLNDVGPGLGDDRLTRWFTDNAVNSLDQAEMNRQQTLLAAAVDDPTDSWQIRVYRVKGLPPLLPEACFAYNTDDADHNPDEPVFSPDGYGIAFELDGGIAVGRIPAMPTSCLVPSENARIVVQEASSPDWGPADVPVAPPAPAPTPAPAPAPAPSTPAGPAAPGGPAAPAQPNAPAALQVSASAARLRAALSEGLRLQLKLPAGGSVAATARLGSRVVARGTLANARPGARTLTLRFTAAGRSALRSARSAKLRINVSVKPVGATPQTRTLTVTLRR